MAALTLPLKNRTDVLEIPGIGRREAGRRYESRGDDAHFPSKWL
jgi:hypothetical protein